MKGWLMDMDEAEEQTTGDLELAIEGGLSTALFPSLASQMHPGAVPVEEGRNDWPGGGKYDRHSNSRTSRFCRRPKLTLPASNLEPLCVKQQGVPGSMADSNLLLHRRLAQGSLPKARTEQEMSLWPGG